MKIFSFIKKFFWNIYIKSDPSRYNEKHKGAFTFWRVFILNLIRPGRILQRIKYKHFFLNKKKIQNYFYQNFPLDEDKNNRYDKNFLSKKLLELVDNGCVVLDQYFTEKDITEFKNFYSDIIENIKNFKNDQISYNIENLQISNYLNKIWLDKKLIHFISSFFRGQTYARNYPSLFYTYVPEKVDLLNSKAASNWHVDHSTLFNLHVLLEDVSKENTCMEAIPSSHTKLNYASNYSEKVVKDYFKKEPIKCYGKKGTVYMHTGNVIHRLKPVENSNRLNLHFEFSPGNNILLDINGIKKCLDKSFNLDELSYYERIILSGLFPKKLLKGYNLKNGSFYPNPFQGI